MEKNMLLLKNSHFGTWPAKKGHKPSVASCDDDLPAGEGIAGRRCAVCGYPAAAVFLRGQARNSAPILVASDLTGPSYTNHCPNDHEPGTLTADRHEIVAR